MFKNKMREIKFRAWDKKSKRMFVVESLRIFKDALVNRGRKYSVYENGYVCDNETELMQFTGLRDKNDKEIYEGDIIKFKLNPVASEEYIGFIKWSKILCSFIIIKGEKYGGHIEQVVEVIGNIYKNLELLKEKIK